MAAAVSSTDSSAIFVLLLVLFLLVRRTYAQVTGARFSPARLFVFGGFYLLLFVAFGFSTIYGAVGAWGPGALALVAPYAAVVAAAGWFATGYVRRIVRFEQRNGAWYYRLPYIVPIVSLLLFVIRFGVEILVFGFASTSSFLLPGPLSGSLLAVLISVDLLFGGSVGLLLGRAVGVYRAHRELATVPPGEPSPPLPSA